MRLEHGQPRSVAEAKNGPEIASDTDRAAHVGSGARFSCERTKGSDGSDGGVAGETKVADAAATEPTDFTFTRAGTTGCEIRDQEGRVVAWTVDQAWAEAIVTLLIRAEVNLGRVQPDT